MARELDDAILMLRINELELGLLLLKTRAIAEAVLAADAVMLAHRNDWFVRETIGLLRRTLARLDVSSRSLFAIIEPGSCFAGTLFELALAADRSYMLALPDEEGDAPRIAVDDFNFGLLPMVNGRSRLQRASAATPATWRPPVEAKGKLLDAGRSLRARPRHLRARRSRLGRRDPHRHRGARQPVARCAHRHGGQPALPRRRDDGDAGLRPALGLAELDFHSAECRRRAGRAEAVRQRLEGAIQLGKGLGRRGQRRRRERG